MLTTKMVGESYSQIDVDKFVEAHNVVHGWHVCEHIA